MVKLNSVGPSSSHSTWITVTFAGDAIHCGIQVNLQEMLLT